MASPVVIRCALRTGPVVRRDALTGLLQDVTRLAGVGGFAVGVVLTTDLAMARLNRELFGKRGPTDVIALEGPLEWLAPAQPDPALLAALGSEGGRDLGDIMVSVPCVQRRARDHGASLDAHMTRLMVHSVLHLAGYSHDVDGDWHLMEAEEERIRAALPERPLFDERRSNARQ